MRIAKYSLELNPDRLNMLVKESTADYCSEKDSFNSLNELSQMLHDVFHLDQKAEEYVYLLALDGKFHLIGVFEVSHGTANSSLLSPREIFIRALLCGASCIMLAHNHPSGDPTPSGEDIMITKKINEAGKIVNIPLVEHVIMGSGGNMFSFHEEGLIER